MFDGPKKYLLFIVVSIYASLSACSDSLEIQSNPDDSGIVSIPIPSAIAKTRINSDALNLSVLVDGRNVTMTPPDSSSESTIWSGMITVPAGESTTLSVRWSTTGIDLAILERAIAASTSDFRISFNESEYRYPDDDGDNFTNLQELSATPPTEVDNLNSTPDVSNDDPNVAALSHLTFKTLRLSANQGESTTGTISFTNSGDTPLVYTVTNANTFFGVSPSAGSVAAGSTETLTITGQCSGNAVVLEDVFSLTGNFTEISPIGVTLDCNGRRPSVFTEENYQNSLIFTFGIINSNYLSGAYSAFVQLVRAIIDDDPDPTILTESSRGEETFDNNGDPIYSIQYDCNAGGRVDAQRLGRQFNAELFDCQIGPFVLSGKLLDSGFIESPRQFFSTFSDISATFPGGELTQSGSFSYSADSTTSTYRYTDVQYTYDNGSSNFAISNGSTSATVNAGIYQSEFEFDLIGSVTNNQNLRVKSDSLDKLQALEGFYYTTGNFVVDNVDGDGQMKIEPGVTGVETFQLSLTENGSTTSFSIPWSDSYYFPCGIDVPLIEASVYLCRDSQ